MAKKTTQKDRVLRYLKENGSITPMDALREFGIMRLAAVIFELRADKNNIITEPETRVNRYGDVVTYARYRLVKE